MASRGRWDIVRAKKPRKEDVDDPFGGVSPARAPIAGPLPGAGPAGPGPSAPPPAPHQAAVDAASPPIAPAATVHEAARAFNQLRVRTAPEARDGAASPSASGAGQPGSPKKRKAAAALSGLAAADSAAAPSDDARAAGGAPGGGDTAASGPVGELLQVFGQIQLNKDFYDAIARTESCAGRAPRAGATQADADRAAFEAAVGAATAVLRRQVRGLADAGHDASPAFLQAYALNAITAFATQAESSYSGEDLGGSVDGSSVDRPSTGGPAGGAARNSAERSVGNAPPGQAAAAPPGQAAAAPPTDLFSAFVLAMGGGAGGEGGLQEQITSLERSASAMALQSPRESWGAPGLGGPSASLLMSKAADLPDRAEGLGQSAAPAEDPGAAARRQRRRQRPASAEGEQESLGPQRQVRRSERPALGTVAEQRADAPAAAAAAAVLPPAPAAAAAAAAPATPGAVATALAPPVPAIHSPEGPARDENVAVAAPSPAPAPVPPPPAPAAFPAAAAPAPATLPRPQRPQAAPGHREKRDPRPSSSSGGPSHLSNDPPKRQRKGPGLVVGSAPGPGPASPFASRPASAAASRGSVGASGGGGDAERDDADSGGGSEPSGTAAPAAWGPSLVCADLTLHEVASQYWPSFKAAGKGQAGGGELSLSREEQARVEELTAALEGAILGAVGPGGAAPARRRLNAKVKSLAAASAFDELLRERDQGGAAAEEGGEGAAAATTEAAAPPAPPSEIEGF